MIGGPEKRQVGLESSLKAYRELLVRNRRLGAQVRLFDALRRAHGRTRRLVELIESDHISASTSTKRSDNARRAVHERARALQRTLLTLGARFGVTIGAICWVSWSGDEGDVREYRLEVASSRELLPARGRARVLEVRATAKRLIDSIQADGVVDGAKAAAMHDMAKRLLDDTSALLRILRV